MLTTLGLISLPQKKRKSQEQGRNSMLFCCVVTWQVTHSLLGVDACACFFWPGGLGWMPVAHFLQDMCSLLTNSSYVRGCCTLRRHCSTHWPTLFPAPDMIAHFVVHSPHLELLPLCIRNSFSPQDDKVRCKQFLKWFVGEVLSMCFGKTVLSCFFLSPNSIF